MPTGHKPPPPRAPRRLRTDADLRALQRLMLRALVQPLAPNDRLAPRSRDGRPMAEVAADFIKPNARLSSFERLEIYARCYWFRLLDCAHDDCPGLRALLGEARFSALVGAYLAKYPSRSFTLRNLCERLAQFVREEPRWTAPDTALAHAVARFEWAQTVAFDGGARPMVATADVVAVSPEKLRLALQPYVSLLRFEWPVDEYVIAVKKRTAWRGEASNAVDHRRRGLLRRRVPRPRRGRVFVVVHRYHERVYYKRVEPAAFQILARLAAGLTLAQAVEPVGRRVAPVRVREWFETWTELGWFCRR